MPQKSIISLLLFLFCLEVSYGQKETDLLKYINKRNSISMKGKKAVQTWGIVSLGGGIAGSLTTSGSTEYFFQMTAFLGGVNLITSSYAINSIKRQEFTEDLKRLELEQKQVEKNQLWSGVVDAAIIGAGIGILNHSYSEDVHQERLQGYAYSILLQGSFLFIADATMYYLHKRNRKKGLKPLIEAQYYFED